jgi:hypothetical protein
MKEAVRRAGRAAATFGTEEVRAELAVLRREVRTSDTSIRRHLAAFEGQHIFAVPAGVGVVAEPEELITALRRDPPMRFRLRGSIAPADPVEVLDDTARVLLALYVACGVAGSLTVPTQLVTRVLAAEPRLTLHSVQQTSVQLTRLARQYPRLVTVERGRGRSQLWAAVGVLRPEWAAWVTVRAALLEQELARYGALAEAGAVSAADAAGRMVELVERLVADQTWPTGRPVTVRRMVEEIALARSAPSPSPDESALVHLADLVVRREGDLSEALQSACRQSFGHGGRRRHAMVRRLRPVDERSTCYASAALAPEVVDAWVQWRRAQAACSRHARRRLERERALTTALHRVGDPLLTAFASVRDVLAVEELQRIRALVDTLRPVAPRVSPMLEEARRRLHVRVESTADAWPTLGAAEADARTALAAVGLTLPAVRRGERPTISLAVFAGLMPAAVRRGLSDGVLAANAVTVRKIEDAGGRTSRVGAGRSARYRLDRPDALLYVAENAGLPGQSLLLAGSRLLGPWMADAALARRAASHADAEVRAAGLGALILLGDIKAVQPVCRLADLNALPEVERAAVMAARWWIERLRLDSF